jgi:hypothetical protein
MDNAFRSLQMEGTVTRLGYFAIAVMLMFLWLSKAAAQEPQAPIPAQYSALAVGQAGPAAGKTFGLTVYVDGISADGDIDELIGTLKQKGQDGLVSAMEKMKDLGRVAPTGGVGTGMRVVLIRPTTDGGQHIVLATNRPIAFAELYNSTRSRDYPISIVVLDVDKDGKGAGSFAPLCKVRFNKNKQLEIEHYGQKPFRLTNVYRQTKNPS